MKKATHGWLLYYYISENNDLEVYMDQKRAVTLRDKSKNMYLIGIAVFTGIFTTIAVCVWFVNSLNF